MDARQVFAPGKLFVPPRGVSIEKAALSLYLGKAGYIQFNKMFESKNITHRAECLQLNVSLDL